METNIEIQTKEQAYTVLSDSLSNKIQLTPEQIKQAESFFTEEELLCTVFIPLHNINDCFPGVAKQCIEGICNTNHTSNKQH